MPRVAIKDNSRMSLRIRPEDKALLMRAITYTHTDLTDFVLRNAVEAAKAVIAEAEHVTLRQTRSCWQRPIACRRSYDDSRLA